MDTTGATFSSLKIKKKEVPPGRGPKFTYVPKVSEPKPNKINKLSPPTIIEKLLDESDIGETKILNHVFNNVEVKEPTKSPLTRTSFSSEDVLDDFDLEVAIDKT